MAVTDKESVGRIEIKDFDYPLPDNRIAGHPLAERDACLLLVGDAASGKVEHHVFKELPSLLPSDALMLCNNTRVINARIRFRKSTGAEIEVFLLDPVSPAEYNEAFQATGKSVWKCMVGNLKRWKDGSLPLEREFETSDGRKGHLQARRLSSLDGNAHEIEFSWTGGMNFADVVEAVGFIPIPPYLNRETEESDARDYQTVYAEVKGSVAAPTAGLHFTPSLLSQLKERGIEREEVTLHVGAGTFQPVKAERIGEHPMHTETFSVDREMLRKLSKAMREGRPVFAVGTTTVRTVESLPLIGLHLMRGEENLHVEQWEAYGYGDVDALQTIEAIEEYMDREELPFLHATTSIMIAPGFRWRIVTGMVTNFHQPQSTLLLLVSSFLQQKGGDAGTWRRFYDAALSGSYRFLSYGDACLFF